jgi:hypothetical protein
MPEPTLRNIWNVIAFLEQCPDDEHNGLTNKAVAATLRAIHDAYVDGPNKKLDNAKETK